MQSKNRSTDLLPTDSHRVFLSPGSEDEGSDYINASWLTGDGHDDGVGYDDDGASSDHTDTERNFVKYSLVEEEEN